MRIYKLNGPKSQARARPGPPPGSLTEARARPGPANQGPGPARPVNHKFGESKYLANFVKPNIVKPNYINPKSVKY